MDIPQCQQGVPNGNEYAMVKITIQNLFQAEIQVQDLSKPVLVHVGLNNIDWMHACGGKGRCTTCRFRVVEGEQHLEALTQAEEQYRKQNLLTDHERLACQARLNGDIVVLVPDDCKLPHITYSA